MCVKDKKIRSVALFTRAWIEIETSGNKVYSVCVALFTRAWIEIFVSLYTLKPLMVALFTRAWIEMLTDLLKKSAIISRPLHEGVD